MQTANPKSTVVPKVSHSILCWFIVYSGIPQMQGTSSWLWGFNLLLLRLHREISLSLLCLHSSCGSALVLAPPLRVGCPQASVPPTPDRRGLKQRVIRGLWLTHARGREGYSSYNWNTGQACSSRAQHDVAKAWGAPCVLPGKLSLDHRTLAVAGCTALWGVVWIVTCTCTQDSWWLQQQR